MSYILEFDLPGLPPSMNARMHWRKRHKVNSDWKLAVLLATRKKLPERPLEKAKLTLIRMSSVAVDADNLVASFKPVIDGLVEAGILVNDKWENIGMPEFRWEKTKPRLGGIRVVVEEIKR